MAKRKTLTKAQQERRRKLRVLARGAGLVVLVIGLAAAWVWHRTLPLTRIDVVGTEHASPADVAALVGVAPDSVAPIPLYGLDVLLLADRAERHPWVYQARLRRMPTGTLRIAVSERTPVALVLDARGAPHHYLDASGYAMPVPDGADTEDVPLLRGRGVPAYHPTQPVESAGLRELLAALATADDDVDAVVSEIEWKASGATLITEPVAGRAPLTVRLGATGHADALTRLSAFWDQAVLTRPDVPIRLVDLRFAGQVVTRETAPTRHAGGAASGAAPDSSASGAPDTDAAPEAIPTPVAAPEPAADGPGTGSDSVASPPLPSP